MDRGSYQEVRGRVSLAVKDYKAHTDLIKDFITRHGHTTKGWETWDVAPFHVLNARKGEPVPEDILHALDSAIEGRLNVTDQFTEANINPKVFMDASDISHRVFAEKLRTLRRVWFPNIPEPTSHSPTNATSVGTNSNLAIVQTSTDDDNPTKFGIFSALAGDPARSDFYKISFDAPVEMTIVSGTSKRSFEVGLGHVKFKPCGARPNALPPSRPKPHLPSLQRTAKEVAAQVSAQMRGEYRKAAQIARGASLMQKTRKKVEPKKLATNAQVARRTRMMTTRSMARNARLRASKPESIEISDNDDDAANKPESGDRTLSAGSRMTTRANPFAARQRTAIITPVVSQPDEGLAVAPVPAFTDNGANWIVDVSSFGDVTFYDPTGKSPITYIEEDEAKKMLRELIIQLQPIVVNVKWRGQTHQLYPAAIRMLATDQGESIVAIIPQLVSVT